MTVGLSALASMMSGEPLHARPQSQSVLSLLSTEGRSLAVGQEVSGALSASDLRAPDDSPLEAWSLEGRAGQTVTVDLRSSEFDAYLYLIGPGFDETLQDDDGAGGCDARLGVTFLESGSFTVVASSQSGGTGTYGLSVAIDPAPAAAYDCGGVDPSALLELPTAGRLLPNRGMERGVFDGSETTIQDGRPATAWALEGVAGGSATVRLVSDAFDAYLHVFGPGMPEVLSDDDGGGDLNSEVTIRFPETGTYRVVASALSAGSRGSYTLETVDPVDLATLSTAGRVVAVDETVFGLLPESEPAVVDGRPGQAWALQGSAGQSVSIELVASDFDPYLYLVGPGLDLPLEDDDGGGDRNARIDVTFPQTGTYRVIVSAYASGSGGSFTVQVTAR